MWRSATQENELGELYLSNVDFLKNGVPASIIATLVSLLFINISTLYDAFVGCVNCWLYTNEGHWVSARASLVFFHH